MPITIAGVQMDVRLADRAANLAKMVDRLREAAELGARLVAFPECALAGYCYDSLEEALPHGEPLPGPATERFTAACRELGTYVVFGLLERVEDRLYNACALVGPAGLVGGYRKIHLPFLGIDRFVTPGDRAFSVWPAGDLRLGMNICYDGSFPESARVMTLAGADLVVLPTNWPPGSECTAAHVIHARAMENHIYYMAVNRVGTERGFRFIGHSKICDPHGQTLCEAPHENEALMMATIDVDQARQKRIIRVPGKHEINRVADRRPEMYGPLVAPK